MDGILNWIERLFDGSLISGGTFLVIGIVGGVLLLISLALDGIFDAFDFGDGPLSLTTIAAFMSIFGFTAFASVGAGLPASTAGLLGAGAGFVGGAGAWWLSRLIKGAESNTSVSGSDLVGSEGAVVLAIPEGGLGEVAVIRHGERISLSASADTSIPRGSLVRITHIVTSTSVRVEPVSTGPATAGPDPVTAPGIPD